MASKNKEPALSKNPTLHSGSKKTEISTNNRPVMKSKQATCIPIPKEKISEANSYKISNREKECSKESPKSLLSSPKKSNTGKNIISNETNDKSLEIIYRAYSKTGMSPDNPKKVNQDSFFHIESFANIPGCYLFGICDGHGQFGKEISSFIANRLPIIIMNSQNLLINPKQALISSVELLQAEILHTKLDTSFSGSTLNLILILNRIIYCANVGDSRSVLSRKDPKK